jgi:hypothetical protein
MDIEIVFDTNGSAVAGVDRHVLVADIQAELDKLASQAGAKPIQPTRQLPPEGAQGDFASLHWLLHMATDPAMAKVYAQGLVFAINSLLAAAKSKENGDTGSAGKPANPSQAPAEKLLVNISLLGKEIALPATTAVIKAILDQIGSN